MSWAPLPQWPWGALPAPPRVTASGPAPQAPPVRVQTVPAEILIAWLPPAPQPIAGFTSAFSGATRVTTDGGSPIESLSLPALGPGPVIRARADRVLLARPDRCWRRPPTSNRNRGEPLPRLSRNFDPVETTTRRWFWIDFGPELGVGETIATATFVCSLVRGTDAAAATRVLSMTSANGTQVGALCGTFVEGVWYSLEATATTSLGNTLVNNARVYCQGPNDR